METAIREEGVAWEGEAGLGGGGSSRQELVSSPGFDLVSDVKHEGKSLLGSSTQLTMTKNTAFAFYHVSNPQPQSCGSPNTFVIAAEEILAPSPFLLQYLPFNDHFNSYFLPYT